MTLTHLCVNYHFVTYRLELYHRFHTNPLNPNMLYSNTKKKSVELYHRSSRTAVWSYVKKLYIVSGKLY